MSFLSSQAAKGYNPQFLDTTPQMGAETPSSGSADLTNRLLQIMSGNLGGTLSSGEKLSALGALLKSVSRGSQTSPQQVMQSIQQQKMQEVQGALQIQELRKAAQRQAQAELQKQQLIANETDPRRKAFLEMASAEDIGAIAREEFKYRDPLQGLSQTEAILARRYGYNTPEYNRLMDEFLAKPQYTTGPGGSFVRIPGLSIKPSEASVFAEARTAISQGANPVEVRARIRSLGFDDGKL